MNLLPIRILVMSGLYPLPDKSGHKSIQVSASFQLYILDADVVQKLEPQPRVPSCARVVLSIIALIRSASTAVSSVIVLNLSRLSFSIFFTISVFSTALEEALFLFLFVMSSSFFLFSSPSDIFKPLLQCFLPFSTTFLYLFNLFGVIVHFLFSIGDASVIVISITIDVSSRLSQALFQVFHFFLTFQSLAFSASILFSSLPE
jgi:hypothetical protein